MDYTTGVYEVGRTVELNAGFHINLLNTKYNIYTSAGISIVSVALDKLPKGDHYDSTEKGMSVYIPPINIRWGCFAQGAARVQNVYVGSESQLLRVGTEGGKTLHITDTHPLVLADGPTVPVRDVRPGQRVKTADGEEWVKWIYQ